jgi:hypothetical protein
MLTWLISGILPIKKYLIVGSITLAIVAAIFAFGYDKAKDNQREEQTKSFIETTERINETPRTTTRDDALIRLRRNGDLR